jgi:hypothetical protein
MSAQALSPQKQPLAARVPVSTNQPVTTPAPAIVDTAARTAPRMAAVLALAWSAEDPDDIAPDSALPAERFDAAEAAESTAALWRYLRPGLLFAAAGALTLVAIAGLLVTLRTGSVSIAPAIKTASPPPSVAAVVTPPPQAAPPPPSRAPTVTTAQVSPHSATLPRAVPSATPTPPPPPHPTPTPKPASNWPPYHGIQHWGLRQPFDNDDPDHDSDKH